MVGLSEATQAADRLKAQGQWAAAIAAHQAITKSFPTSPFAFHNLAATLGDAGQAAAAEEATKRAMRLGLDAPETWLVRARAVQAQGRLDEAERLFRETLRRRPLYLDALRDFSQLCWMRTASAAEALRPIDSALQQAPGEPALVLLKARTLAEADDKATALGLLRSACVARPDDARLALALAQMALAEGAAAEALVAARRAVVMAPEQSATQMACIDALLVLGEAAQAEQRAAALCARSPHDQHALARLATAWRLLGDARYGLLYDYEAFVSVEQLDTPSGWPDLASFVADLAAALHGEHHYRTHPYQQSIRQGSQITNILQLPHRATQALVQAIDGPIRRHLAKLGRGDDPVRGRNLGGYANRGGWSIRMQAGGLHVNHVHAEGWISSACYVQTPEALVEGEGRLKLGEPGIPLDPLPPPERFVDPKPGRIVFFPSYMWHGTTAFGSNGVRMSVAFDLEPAPGPRPA